MYIGHKENVLRDVLRTLGCFFKNLAICSSLIMLKNVWVFPVRRCVSSPVRL